MKSFFNSQLFDVLFFLLVFIINPIRINQISKKHIGFCPKCGKEFKASTLELLSTFNIVYKFYLKCPHCGHRGMKPFRKDKREII